MALRLQVCTDKRPATCSGPILTSGTDSAYVSIDLPSMRTGMPGQVQLTYHARTDAPITGTFYFKVDITLDGTTLGGASDVYATTPEDYLLHLANNGGSTPDAIYAAVVRPQDLGYSTSESGVSEVNGMDIRSFSGGIVGEEFNMIFQPRDTFGIEIPAAFAQLDRTRLGAVIVRFYRIGDVNARAPVTTDKTALLNFVRGLPVVLTMSKKFDTQSFGTDPVNQFDQYITYNAGNGTYTIKLPRIDTVTGSAAVPNIILSGSYAMVVESRMVGNAAFAVSYINPRVNLIFYPAASDARAIVVRNCTNSAIVLAAPNAAVFVEAGSAIDFCLQAKDRFGNDAIWLPFQGGDPITGEMIRFGGGDNADIVSTYTDYQNGTYRLSFNQVLAGTYKVIFKIRGASLSNSVGTLPLKALFPLDTGTEEYYLPLRIFASKLDPSKCVAVFFDRTRVDERSTITGTLLTVYIQEVDRFGNVRTHLTVDANGNPIYFNIRFTQIGNATQTWTIAPGSSVSVTDLGVVVNAQFSSQSLARTMITPKSISGANVGYLLDVREDPGLHVFNYLSGGPRAPFFFSGNFDLSIQWPGSPGVPGECKTA